jgi:hypothetical protein
LIFAKGILRLRGRLSGVIRDPNSGKRGYRDLWGVAYSYSEALVEEYCNAYAFLGLIMINIISHISQTADSYL